MSKYVRKNERESAGVTDPSKNVAGRKTEAEEPDFDKNEFYADYHEMEADYFPKDQVKEKKKKKKWLRAVIIIAIILVVLAAAAFFLFRYMFGGLRQVKLNADDLGISSTRETDQDIQNFLLFGVDTRDVSGGDQYRSDSIIIASVNYDTDEIKLTSILRDSKVVIEGEGEAKINVAYRLGGAPLAIKTINQNFDMDIKDYISVDLSELAQIIDYLGGIDVEITELEAGNMALTCPEKPVSAGWNHLDGDQAVAYARVRKPDSDYYRASRQQTVLNLLFEKMKSLSLTEYPAAIKFFLESVETSFSYGDIIDMATKLDIQNAEIVKNTIPDEQYESNLFGDYDETGVWYFIYDLDEATDRLHNIIYGAEE